MSGVMIAAMGSGCGKTVFTCALVRALKNRGYTVHTYKSGPDYIDPMYLSRAAGEPCRNLDIFLQGETGAKKSFEAGDRSGQDAFSVVEAAMGYYDGVGKTDEASAYAVARLLSLPVVLLVKPGAGSLTLAAQIRGMLFFRESSDEPGETSNIKAVVLNDCSERMYDVCAPVIERECGIHVAGYLPHIKEAELPSRHLGLYTADETEDLMARFDIIGKALEETVDVHYICSL